MSQPKKITIANSSAIPSTFAILPSLPLSAFSQASAPDALRLCLYETSIVVAPTTGRYSFELSDSNLFIIAGCYRKESRPGGQVYVTDVKPVDKTPAMWSMDMPEGRQPFLVPGTTTPGTVGGSVAKDVRISILTNFSWPNPAWPFVGIGAASKGDVVPLVTWDAQPGRIYGLDLAQLSWALAVGKGQTGTILDESVWTTYQLGQVMIEHAAEAKFEFKSNGTIVQLDNNAKPKPTPKPKM